jgi:shikimate dehydrogenase
MKELYAVIGNPIAHSKSPYIHCLFAEKMGKDISYEAILSPLDQFKETVFTFIKKGGCGMNVTVPFKLEAFTLATQLTLRAQLAGAVNTLIFSGQEIKGDNTDGVGLVRDIIENQKVSLTHKKILLLGAGGAARGVILPILEQSPAQLVIANRSIEKAQALKTQFASSLIEVRHFDELTTTFDVVVNATSMSIGGQIPPVSSGIFHAESLAYDMMYGASLSPFLSWAKEQGVKVSDGLGMLVEQAAESFFVWHGVRPDTGAVLCALREQLSVNL